MKVVLLYPEVYEMARFGDRRREFPPLGVLNLGAAIEKAGHSVRVIAVSTGHASLDLREFQAVGFSLSSSATYNVMLAARRHAKIDEDALIMVGGVHCTLYPHDSLNEFNADVACVGQCEDTIVRVLAGASSMNFSGIPGILWKNNDRLSYQQAVIPPRSMEQVPLPARHLLPTEELIVTDRLAGTSLRMTHVAFSRGCAFDCVFCSAGRTRVRYRSGAQARRELTELIEQYGIEGFAIVEDNFTIDRRRVVDIAHSIRDLGLAWSAPSRVDTVDPPTLAAMAEAGCIELKFGMESGSPRMLAAMGKRTDPERIRQSIAWANQAGIDAKVFVIHGFPGETTETTRETIAMLTSLGSAISRVSLFRFVPLPGSLVYNRADLYGISGTHQQPGWDGDWSKFHIHHNARQWWGDTRDWQEVQDSYQELKDFVEANWNVQG